MAKLKRDERICPYCAETIKATAIKCRFCQSDVTPVVEPDSAPDPAPTKKAPAAAAGKKAPAPAPTKKAPAKKAATSSPAKVAPPTPMPATPEPVEENATLSAR